MTGYPGVYSIDIKKNSCQNQIGKYLDILKYFRLKTNES